MERNAAYGQGVVCEELSTGTSADQVRCVVENVTQNVWGMMIDNLSGFPDRLADREAVQVP